MHGLATLEQGLSQSGKLFLQKRQKGGLADENEMGVFDVGSVFNLGLGTGSG
jgi:hypothetical protein